MQSPNEQLAVIMQRADSIRHKNKLRKQLMNQSFSVCTCIVLIVMTCFYLPEITLVTDSSLAVQFGSLILNTFYIGYVVVGVLAFILGILITTLCLTWKNLNRKEHE